MNTNDKLNALVKLCALAALVPLLAGTPVSKIDGRDDGNPAKTLYVWTGDQARVRA